MHLEQHVVGWACMQSTGHGNQSPSFVLSDAFVHWTQPVPRYQGQVLMFSIN